MSSPNSKPTVAIIGGDVLTDHTVNKYFSQQKSHFQNVHVFIKNSTLQSQIKSLGGLDVQVTKYEQDRLTETLKGVDTLLVLPPISMELTLNDAMNAVKAAKSAGVKNIIVISFIGAGSVKNNQTLNDLEKLEKLVKEHFPNNCILRANFLDQFFKLLTPAINENNTLHLPIQSNTHMVPVDLEDVLKAATQILKNKNMDKQYVNQVRNLTGPQPLDGQKIAQIVGKQLHSGKNIKYEHTERKNIETVLHKSLKVQSGKPTEIPSGIHKMEVASLIKSVLEICEAGNHKVLSEQTQDIERITGTQPISLEQYLVRSA